MFHVSFICHPIQRLVTCLCLAVQMKLLKTGKNMINSRPSVSKIGERDF